jgi:hypothetical protein
VLQAGPQVWIYHLRGAAPRLKFTTRVEIGDADAVTGTGGLLVEPSPDRVLIDDDTPPAHGYDGTQSPIAGTARIVSWAPDRITIEAESERGGVLVLHDTYYPGWIAEVDGRATPILRADILFRGVELPPGFHRVVFRFAPLSLDNLKSALKLVLWRQS